MADVKWIKVYTNMISNKKIKRIRKMPDGNNIILIWVFLLAEAGESNKNGALYLADTIPYTINDLAIEFDFPVDTINLALLTLEKYQMIEMFDSIIYIKNWSKYQNIDGLEKIREQTRNRVAKHRKKFKELPPCNVTCNVTVTEGNATDIELDKDIDKKDIYNNAINLCKYFSSIKVGQSITQHISQLQIFIGDYGYEWCLEALKKTIEKINKFSPNYMETILKDWKLNGKPKLKKEDEKQTTNSSAYNEFDFSFMGGGNANGKDNNTSTT